MFSDRIVLLARDMEAASELRELVAQCNPFHEILTLDAADPAKRQDFLQPLASGKPDLVFAEVRDFRDIAEVLEPLLAADPMLPLIVYSRKIENHAYLELNRLGFGNRLIHLPAKREALERAVSDLRAARTTPLPPASELCPVVSFMPGKPGSGASTAAWHFANLCSELLGARVALVDLDLNCGVQALFGAVQTGMNLYDAISIVDHTGRMPDHGYLPSRGDVDILSTQRRCRSSRIDSRLFDNFLTAIRAAYRLVVVDHSGNWERFSVQAMKASAIVFCVCGNDYLSLTQTHHAKALMEEEGFLGAVRLLLNRHGSSFGVSLDEAERLAGLQIAASLPNCFGQLQQAVLKNRMADPRGAYAVAMAKLAAHTLKALRLSGDEETGQLNRWEESRSWLAAIGLHRRRVAAPSTLLERS
jgi:Flp pilus assembly CpaE family ATPase